MSRATANVKKNVAGMSRAYTTKPGCALDHGLILVVLVDMATQRPILLNHRLPQSEDMRQ